MYYNELYYTQAQTIMKDDGVSNVPVPTATSFFADSTAFSPTALSAALSSVSSSTKLNGTRGVGSGPASQ